MKEKLGFNINKPLKSLLLAADSELGRINSAIVAIRENLLSREASVFLISGNQQYEEILKQTDERQKDGDCKPLSTTEWRKFWQQQI
ncbi:hypothetical protein KOY49_01580 [Candidatus Minimicrobia vallesae]|uniref:Uncharacterized protein n=1 Tax=Candidatus Minimicrobia vallesae TaxID=2841264 RepID=A0A8F1MAT9_9BACT|nr:hypothetical protein [Candidatus Minimicrobia vallesae]QWQ31685.1 hypothetical protein KOY49_01580 [Candidatus Minimicrobia vallesae]